MSDTENLACPFCGGALEMNVITPAAVAMKRDIRWAIDETAPATIGETHQNCG